MASNETNYTMTVTGEMAPVEFFILIVVREKANLTVPSVRNETEEPVISLPEPTPPDDGFDMYSICFPLLLLLLLLGVVAINNFLALTAKDDEDDDEPEHEAKDDEEGEG